MSQQVRVLKLIRKLRDDSCADYPVAWIADELQEILESEGQES